MADFMVVAYKRGCTRMERRFEGRWTRTECRAGDVSLLTRSQMSHWHWTEPIDVAHVYLTEALMSNVAADVLDRSIADVRLHDLLQTQDAVVNGIADAITREAGDAGVGSALCAEALGTQLAVHLLRRYASVDFVDRSGSGQLPQAVCRRIIDHIESSLDQAVSLEQLASLACMGVWSFSKRFRASFHTTPHNYITDRRLERARQLLVHGNMPVKAVAVACGFADQAHLTRVMRARLGCTPAALRQDGSA